jgi:hypothetical protein
MPKKTKRTNQSRRGNGFDSPAGKNRRDKITGFYVDVNGERLYSDKAYDMLSSPEGKAIASLFWENPDGVELAAGGGGASIELELGTNSIAMTTHTFGIKVPPASNFVDNASTRWIFLGDFDYSDKNLLKSGRVKEVANWSHSTEGEYSSVDKSSPITAGGFISILQIWRQQQRVFDNLTFYNDGYTEGDPKDNFYNFESSKYFESGWWNNPFNTNLI